MAETSEDYCERCGEHEPGKHKWMAYRWYETFPKPPITRQFFCFRCLRIMNIYAIIGLFLLACIVVAIVFVLIWLKT